MLTDPRTVRPITGGTLTGPLFNAKVSGGFAADGFYNGGAQQRPTVYLYGTTDDNSAFYIQEVGVGNQASWLTRAVSFPGLTAVSFPGLTAVALGWPSQTDGIQALEVGGKYASLSDAFLVPNNAADKTGSVIQVPIYKVTGAGCC